MKTWFTSDPHWDHANIIEYCERPYTSVAQMQQGMAANWNEVVAPEDTVYVLGDVTMGRVDNVGPLLSVLNGTKILVLGNHDRAHPMHKNSGRHLKNYYHYFDAIHTLIATYDLCGIDVAMCHFPREMDSRHNTKYDAQRPRDMDPNKWLLCGHVHNSWLVKGRDINVGVDVWDWYPVQDETLAAMILERPDGEKKAEETPQPDPPVQSV